MGRGIRRVPPDWQHPKNEYDGFQPLFDRVFERELKEWTEGQRRWDAGEDPARAKYEAERGYSVAWEDWHGNPPDPAYHRPDWPEESRTAYQVYETVSEGTPISPVFPTEADLLAWLTQPDGAPGMGIGGRKLVMDVETARRFVAAAWAPSMVMQHGKMESGIAIHRDKP